MRLTARKKILVSEAATVERAQKGKTYPRRNLYYTAQWCKSGGVRGAYGAP
nr:MAG TPA: hypothetical protein [Caudoviricetes sp.]